MATASNLLLFGDVHRKPSFGGVGNRLYLWGLLMIGLTHNKSLKSFAALTRTARFACRRLARRYAALSQCQGSAR